MIAWMTYALLVSALVATAGHLLEGPSASFGIPRRLVWLGVMGLSCLIPFTATPEAVPLPELTIVSTPTLSPSVSPEAPISERWDSMAFWGWVLLSALWALAAGSTLFALAAAKKGWKRNRVWARSVLVSRGFGPALVGVRHPEIVLPNWVLRMAPEDLQVVVEHEDEHRKAKDHLVLLVGAAMAGVLAWNPVAWWCLRQLRRGVEVDCDQRVLEGGTPVARYGRVLLDVSEGRSGSWGFAPGMVHPTSTLERRLRTMGMRNTKRGARIWVSLAAGLVMVFAACETPAPTAVRNAMDDALATRAAAQEVEQETPPEGVRIILEGTPSLIGGQPLVFVDGKRVDDELGEIEVESIDRVEVMKGEAAKRLFGEEARGGVIQIYLKGYEAPDPPRAPRSVYPTQEVDPQAPPTAPGVVWVERARVQEETSRAALERAATQIEWMAARTDGANSERLARQAQEVEAVLEATQREMAIDHARIASADRRREVDRLLAETEAVHEALQSTRGITPLEWERERRRLREALLSIGAQLQAMEGDLDGPRRERMEEVRRQLQTQLEALQSQLRNPRSF